MNVITMEDVPVRTEADSLSPLWAIGLPAVLTLALIGIFWPTARDIYDIWMRSGTFTHGVLVVPISVWLLWRERATLVDAGFRPSGLPLVFLAGAGMLWVLGEAVSAAVVSQFALAFMIIAGVWLCWGNAATRRAAFPLAFLLFAVPFGEFMVPTLMQHTADFTVALLRVSGVPVYQEGMSFVIPSGRWSVVEACSGIRYLIASGMVGVLFAYLNYSSMTRRVLFVIAALIVPIVANWLRAYGIVMLGHHSGNQLAVGADHLVYGWVFFGIVIGILFWVGSLWRDDKPLPPPVPGAASGRRPWGAEFVLLGFAALVVAFPRPLLARVVNLPGAGDYRLPAITPASAWRAAGPVDAAWQPLYEGARAEQGWRLESGAARVYLHVAYYARQVAGHELVQFGNRFIAPEDPQWTLVGPSSAQVELPDGRVLAFERAEIIGTTSAWHAWRTHWLGESVTPSARAAKLDLLKARLLRQRDDSAGVVIWTPSGDAPEHAERTLHQFVVANWGNIEAALQSAAAPQ